MKLINKTALLTAGVLASSAAMADFSANAGWMSEYHFRGIFQKNSSAYAGLDFEQNGFYVGTWAADVDNGPGADGLEVDGYFGYGGEIEGFTYGIGFTGYYYTGDFDDTYQEINLSGGYEWLSVAVALGEYENFDGPTQDYTFYSITGEYAGFYATLGGFSQDFDGNYLEVGYGWDFSGVDLGISAIVAEDDLTGRTETDESLIFTIGKSFDLD